MKKTSLQNILFCRHLNEIDDLRLYGRDAPLLDSADNKVRQVAMVNAIYEKVMRNKKKYLLFVTSPKVRARETARLVAHDISELSRLTIKMRFSVNENLRASEQGQFILPDNYQAGEVFEALKHACIAFEQECHASDTPGGVDNIDYRFGDPLLQANGDFKYPEFANTFSTYGETYRETLIRMFAAVIETSSKFEKLDKNTELVIIGHGQTYHLFRGLEKVAGMIMSSTLSYNTGDLVGLLWKIYKNCSLDEKVTGICMPLQVGLLQEVDMMTLLQEELNFLKSPLLALHHS